MLFVAIAALVFGYGVVYSGVQTLRGGPTRKVGVLQCLTPGFDPVAVESAIAQGKPGTGGTTGNSQPAQGQGQTPGASKPAPVVPPNKSKTSPPLLDILPFP